MVVNVSSTSGGYVCPSVGGLNPIGLRTALESELQFQQVNAAPISTSECSSFICVI